MSFLPSIARRFVHPQLLRATPMSSVSSSLKPVQPIQGRSFGIALVQLGNITGDKDSNLNHASTKLVEAITELKKQDKADLVVLPECFNSPYGVQYFDSYAEVIDFKAGTKYDIETSQSGSVKLLSKIARENKIWLIGGSIPERDTTTGKLYNTATVYNREGELVDIHRKLHLFDIDIPGGISFQESKTLTGGDKVTVFDTEFGKLGLGICYDLRFPEMAMLAARKGAIAMVYPGAFNTTTGPAYWEILQRARAVDNQIYCISCSPARPTGEGYPAYGHSSIIDPTGKVAFTTGHEEDIVYATIDVDIINTTKRNIPISVQRRFDAYPDVAA